MAPLPAALQDSALLRISGETGELPSSRALHQGHPREVTPVTWVMCLISQPFSCCSHQHICISQQSVSTCKLPSHPPCPKHTRVPHGSHIIPHKPGCTGMKPPLPSPGLDLNFKPCPGPGAQTLCSSALKGLAFFCRLSICKNILLFHVHAFPHLLSRRTKVPW